MWSHITEKCYKGFPTSASWSEAAASCKNGAALLAEHQTNSSIAPVIEAISLAGPGEFWLNGRKADTGSSYLWSSDNSEVSQELWGPGYPAITGVLLYQHYMITKLTDRKQDYNLMYALF